MWPFKKKDIHIVFPKYKFFSFVFGQQKDSMTEELLNRYSHQGYTTCKIECCDGWCLITMIVPTKINGKEIRYF